MSILTAIQARRPLTKLSYEEEADLIALAQNGDKDAIEQLIRNYAGLLIKEINWRLKSAASGSIVTDPRAVQEDITSLGILAFIRAINAWDPARGRFAGLVQRVLRNDPDFTNVLNQARPLPVPQQTLIRRAQAMRAAGGDLTKARELAPQFGLTRETFDAVSNVFNGPEDVSPTSEEIGYSAGSRNAAITPMALRMEEPGYVRLEHLQDAERALDTLDFVDRMVVESFYGLNGQPEMSQQEIAVSIGVTRQAVRKRLASAMTKMQAAMAEKE